MIVFLVVPPVALAPSVQQEAMTVPSPTPLSTEATQHNQTHNQTSEPCVQETQPYDDCGPWATCSVRLFCHCPRTQLHDTQHHTQHTITKPHPITLDTARIVRQT